MWAVVPAKPFARAKHRLAAVLSPSERAALARLMLTDLLGVLAAVGGLSGVLVVGTDPALSAICTAHDAERVADNDEGHTAAVVCALNALRRRSAGAALVISADIPAASTEEIEALLAAHAADAARGPAMTLVPDRRTDGTNAIACSPPDCIPYAFGLGSLQRHLAAARARGVIARTLALPGIALDLDEPDDLAAFLAGAPDGAAAGFLADRGVAAKSQARGSAPGPRWGNAPGPIT